MSQKLDRCVDCGKQEPKNKPFEIYGRWEKVKRCELCQEDHMKAIISASKRRVKFRVFDKVLKNKWPLKEGLL